MYHTPKEKKTSDGKGKDNNFEVRSELSSVFYEDLVFETAFGNRGKELMGVIARSKTP